MSRDIDALVAEHVMGQYKGFAQEFIDAERLMSCPKYSTDIAAAWEVVEKREHRHFSLVQRLRDDYLWDCHIYNGGPTRADTVMGWAEHKSAPMAISIAALKAKGIEIPNDET